MTDVVFERVFLPADSAVCYWDYGHEKSVQFERGWYDVCRNTEPKFIQILMPYGWVDVMPYSFRHIDIYPKDVSQLNRAGKEGGCAIGSCQEPATRDDKCERHFQLLCHMTLRTIVPFPDEYHDASLIQLANELYIKETDRFK